MDKPTRKPTGRPFQKGQSGNPAGKPKGTKNKITTDLQAKILEVMANLEGQKKGLQDVAEEDPKWFYETFVKALLPKSVKAEIDMPTPLILNLRRSGK